jgi:hypothetical protein
MLPHMANRILLAAICLHGIPALAQQWQQLPSTQHPPLRTTHLAMALDPLRQRLVCIADTATALTPFGDQGLLTTFEWDGTRWLRRATGAPIVTEHERQALAFDPSRGRLLSIGRGDLLTSFDGDAWQTIAAAGEYFSAPSLCFDPVRGVMIAVQDRSIFELQGNSWVARATMPSGNHDTRACFDPSTGTLLIWGGWQPGLGHDNRTWSWNGTTVQQLPAANPPAGRVEHVLALDPTTNQVVLAGGLVYGPTSGATELDSVHSWNGTDWVQQPSLPQPRHGAVAGAFGGRLHLFGGLDAASERAPELLQRTPGGNWIALPLPTAGGFAAHDPVRARTVSVDGTRTLEFDGFTWTDTGVPYPGAPLLGMTFHQSIGRTVAVDEQGTAWRFDGTAWTSLASSPQPPPRLSAGLTYDPVRQRTVLFGGAGGTLWNDLWEWDGTGWTQQPTPALAPAVYALGWDPLGQRLVAARSGAMFLHGPGGWQQAGGLAVPALGSGMQLATTPNGLWLHGFAPYPFSTNGDFSLRLVGDDLQLGATGILDVQTSNGPLVYDQNRGQLVLHDTRNRRDGALTSMSATAQAIGSGCGTGTPPRLLAANLPQLGTGVFTDLLDGAANQAAVLFADLTGTSVPIGGGCTQYLPNPFVLGVAPTGASGFASFGFVVPAAVPLRGFVLHQQALVLHGGGAWLGFADLTGAVRLQLGD